MSKPDLLPFLSTPEPAELGPGPRTGVQSQSELEGRLSPLLRNSHISDEHQELVRALILLWHDHLDPAHEIAQAIDNPNGAFVHGIMHRREPDFSNAAYWFRRVGRHPAFQEIATRVTEVLKTPAELILGTRLVRGNHWDPFAFINACEAVIGKGTSEEQTLRQIQRIETGALLDHLLA